MFVTTTSKQVQLSIGITTWLSIFVLVLLANQATGQLYTVDPIAEDLRMPAFAPGSDTRESVGSGSTTRDGALRPLTSAEKKEISNVGRNIKTLQRKALGGLQGKQSLDTAAVEKYVLNYLLPQMTEDDEQTLSHMGELRTNFVKEILSEKVKAANRAYVIDQVILPRMKVVATGNYHPSARINAVLLVGLINGVEPSRSTLPQVSVPAMEFLLNTMNAAELPVYLKVAAMTGIHRNALFDGRPPTSQMGAPEKSKIETLASSIIKKEAAGQDQWSAEVDYWLRRRSVQTLGFLKNTAFANDLIAMLNNTDESPWIRLDAANALKEMALSAADADRVVAAITAFTAQQMNDEANGVGSALTELVAINMLYGDHNMMDDAQGGIRRPGTGGVVNGLQPKVDLANYQLNQVRRRSKAIGFSAVEALKIVGQRAGGEKRSISNSAQTIITKMMSDVDEGLVDRATESEDLGDGEFIGGSGGSNDQRPMAVADKLADILRRVASDLGKLNGDKPAPEMKKMEGPETEKEPAEPDDIFG